MLKVSSPQPQDIQEPLPNMDMGNEPMIDQPQDEIGIPNDGMPIDNPDSDNQFDNDFDAGVDADEEKDPRRYIEQLAGKLSQKLNDYNQKQEQPDSELCKFVCGMINAQAIKGLSQDDVDEILKKIESDEEFNSPEQQNDENDTVDDVNNLPTDNNQEQSIPQQDNNVRMESVKRKGNEVIDEIFQDLTNPQSISSNIEQKKKDTSSSFRKKPFTSPMFK